MAITWSSPKIGWVNPPQKSIATPCSEWAKAGVGHECQGEHNATDDAPFPIAAMRDQAQILLQSSFHSPYSVVNRAWRV